MHQPLLPDQDASELLSLDSILANQKAMSSYAVYKNRSGLVQTAHILEYLIIRMRECMTELRNTKQFHRKMAALAQLTRELQTMERLPFNMAALFEAEVKISKMPSLSQFASFLKDLQNFNSCEVPGLEETLESFGYKWYALTVTKTLPEEEKEYVLAQSDTVRDFATEELLTISTRYNSLALCSWISECMIASVNEQKNFVLFTAGWYVDELMDSVNLQVLPWLHAGECVVDVIDSGCANDQDFYPRGVKAYAAFQEVTAIHAKVLPRLLLGLTELKGLLEAQVQDAQDMKAKFLAGLLTIGVSVGQFLAQYAFRALLHNEDDAK